MIHLMLTTSYLLSIQLIKVYDDRQGLGSLTKHTLTA